MLVRLFVPSCLVGETENENNCHETIGDSLQTCEIIFQKSPLPWSKTGLRGNKETRQQGTNKRTNTRPIMTGFVKVFSAVFKLITLVGPTGFTGLIPKIVCAL